MSVDSLRDDFESIKRVGMNSPYFSTTEVGELFAEIDRLRAALDQPAASGEPVERSIGEIRHDIKGHPFAVLLTAYDEHGDGWRAGTKIYAAPPAQPAASGEPVACGYEACDCRGYCKHATPRPAPARVPLRAPESCPTHKTGSGDHVICRRCGDVWPTGAERACVRAEKLLLRAHGITPQEGA